MSLLAATFGVGAFIMLARARGWSRLRTVLVTLARGIGHIASLVVLGGLGIVLGLAIAQVESVETGRGPLERWSHVFAGCVMAAAGLSILHLGS